MSYPPDRTTLWACSSAVEQMSYTHWVPGSNPGMPTIISINRSVVRNPSWPTNKQVSVLQTKCTLWKTRIGFFILPYFLNI